MNLVSIIIVNWNAGHQLRDCILSIQEYGGQCVESIIVVDNQSDDQSIAMIEPLKFDLPQLKIIQTGENAGFGRACNIGATYADTDYLLFLNPDAALYPDSLQKIISYMQEDAQQQVGICGVQLIDSNGHIAKSCARFPSAAGFTTHALGIDRIFPKLGHKMLEWSHDQTRVVEQVIGAFFFIRREVFVKLNGFDERFFVYFEEVDLSKRANQNGWKSVYLAQAQAFHSGGGTSEQVKAKRLFYSWRSRVVYGYKHFNYLSATWTLFTTLIVEPIVRVGHALMRRSWGSVKQTCLATILLWRWLPHWIIRGETR